MPPSGRGVRRQIERRLVGRIDRAVGDEQHAERLLRAIHGQRGGLDQPLERRQLLLRPQRVQAAAGPLLLELGREIEVRPRGVARAVVAFEDAPPRDDAQVRVGGRQRDLAARFGRAQLGDLPVVLRLRAPRPGGRPRRSADPASATPVT